MTVDAGKGKGKAEQVSRTSSVDQADANGTTAPANEQKSTAGPTAPALMSNPSSGSANPSGSFPALWGYLEPALDHILRSPSNDPERAPAIDVSYHMGLHTAMYNHLTAAQTDVSSLKNVQAQAPRPPREIAGAGAEHDGLSTSGANIYNRLDQYYTEVARELLLGLPQDDRELASYIVPAFTRFAAGVRAINRLLSYLNRHYVKRALDEDKGWLQLKDLSDTLDATTLQQHHVDGKRQARDVIASLLRSKRAEELKKWGYEEGGSEEQLVEAEKCAEAASPPDRIVSPGSLGLRRFRTEVVEPILAVPKIKGSGKKKKKPPNGKPNGPPPGPKSRLARSVKELLEGDGWDPVERLRLLNGLAAMLKSVGVKEEQALRKRLDKFQALGI